ncbi:MAG: ATP-binding cassette domain-containing protein [Acidimicrobiales bacterium]
MLAPDEGLVSGNDGGGMTTADQVTLELEDVSAAYGQAVAIQGISLSVREGSVAALLGENGAGKTTLLRSISRLHKSTTGRISFAGTEISNLDPSEVASLGMTLVREGAKVFETLSVSDHLALSKRLGGLRRRQKEESQDLERVWEWFPILHERRSQKAGYLSGGQRQMLALSMAFVSHPKLVLMDEPSAGLAESVCENVYEVVQRLSDEGMTLLIAEQSRKWFGGMKGTAYILETGHIVSKQSLSDLQS